jgi:cellulose synthase/poly-beta-1,6-N-acetylglucosamine synthase-like glycosyltransferase
MIFQETYFEFFFNVVVKILIFITLYIGFYLLWIFLEKKKEKNLKLKVFPSVTIVLPIYNKAHCIEWSLNSLYKKNGDYNFNYPKDKVKIVCVDDGSTDKSYELLKKLNLKYNFKLIKKENGGKHTALNLVLKTCKTEVFTCLDADCIIKKNSLMLLIEKLFQEKNIGATTPSIKIFNPKTLLEKLQYFEYTIGFYIRSLYSEINCLHVTPGPLSCYKTKILKELGDFKEAYKTEDLEMCMRLQKNHYLIKVVKESHVYTKAPYLLKNLLLQRVRWYKGGILNLSKEYKDLIFNKKYGEFGIFYLPTFMLFSVLIPLIIIAGTYLLSKELYDFLKELYIFDFNLFIYFSNFSFEFNILNFDWSVVFLFLISFSLVIFYIVFAFKNLEEKLSILLKTKYFWMIIIYFLFYKLTQIYIFIKAWTEIIFKKTVKWNSTEK